MRNEAARLPALLDGLRRQVGCRFERLALCVFFDNCSDGSRALVRHQAAKLPFAVFDEATEDQAPPNAGRARRAALALGLRVLGEDKGILLSTDADSVPAPDWVACSVAALAEADVVAGRIARQPTPPSPLQDRVECYYDRLHRLRRRLDPVAWEALATHHFTGGANLGFRRAAYDAVGGFLPLPFGEDARIVDDAARLGLRVRRDAASSVTTSPRRLGRALGGLATALSQLDEANPRLLVGHPADVVWQYRRHAGARAAFEAGGFDEIAALLGLSPDHALGVGRDCPNAEAFAMRIVPAPPGGIREVTLAEAEAVLATLEAGRLGMVA